MLLEELRTNFAYLQENSLIPLKALPPEWPAFAYVREGSYGVGIELEAELEVNEAFAGARLSVEQIVAQQWSRRALCLESSDFNLRNEFAVVCAQFLEPGVGGEERKSLLADPLAWWEKWRQLLGNAVREKPSYSVIGELLALERLVAQKKAPDWLGSRSGTHDIEASDASYEVKSTLARNEWRVHINGQHQLTTTSGKPLFLIFQRFEPNSNGVSLDDTVDRLVGAGMDRQFIEKRLSRLGYPRGSKPRTERYRLLESSLIKVDDDFPKIVFAGGTPPKGIISIEYVVDLASLAKSPFIDVGPAG